jgi:hypothetical protein
MLAGSPPPTGFVRLYHGTDLASALDIVNNGVNRAKAAGWNASGEFWATVKPDDADLFALTAPGTPARVEFDFPEAVLALMADDSPPRAVWQDDQNVEFLPASFGELNRHATSWSIVSPVP